MTDLDDFAHYITGGSIPDYPSGQKVVFYGAIAPEVLTLEEFAEEYKKFIFKKYGRNGK